MKVSLLVLALLLAITPVSGAAVTTVQIVDAGGGTFAFSPQVVYVALGDTVKWVNTTAAIHTTTSGIAPTADGTWDSGIIGLGGTFQFQFTSSGSYRYFCGVHTTMAGVVRVTRAVVTIQGFAFHPASLTMVQGDTVIFKMQDSFTTHTTTSGTPFPGPGPDGLWDSGFLGTGGQFVLTTGSIPVGQHPFFCQVHNSMKGTLTLIAPVTGVGRGAIPPIRLLAARPNPARHQVELAFELPVARTVRLALADASGRSVRTLLEGPQGAGRHSVRWDGRSASGRLMPAGVYFYRLDAGDFHSTRRFTWVR